MIFNRFVCVVGRGVCLSWCDLQCLIKIFVFFSFTSFLKISRNPISIETTSKFPFVSCEFVCLCVYVCVSGLFYVFDFVPLANHYLICSTENCFVLLLCVDFILRFYVGFSTSTILIICVFIIVSNTKSNRFSLVC
uniref:(northern house mosquito) hypothetical protein n=1 Tax=Culex pipiens TaxID=7175 RepID=A0A8D8FLS5_CULPI